MLDQLGIIKGRRGRGHGRNRRGGKGAKNKRRNHHHSANIKKQVFFLGGQKKRNFLFLSESSHAPFRQFVVHCKKANYDVYIGRYNPQLAKGGIIDFRWGNPFPISETMDRTAVVNAFRQHMFEDVAKMKEVKCKSTQKKLQPGMGNREIDKFIILADLKSFESQVLFSWDLEERLWISDVVCTIFFWVKQNLKKSCFFHKCCR